MKEDDVKVLCDLPRSSRFGRRQLVLIAMECVEPWGKNPTVRTTDLNLRVLGERLAGDIGQLVPGSVVACGKAEGHYKFRLVDGHRRHAIMRVAGVEEFLAVLYLDVEPGSDKFGVLFEILNSGTRAVNLRERVWLALNDEPVAAGKEAAKLAEEISKNLTSEAMKIFMDEFCPTFAFGLAKRAFNSLAELQMEDGGYKNRRAFISRILTWQIKQSEQESLKQFLEDVDAQTKIRTRKRKLNVLLSCVYGDQPFPADAVKGKATDEGDDEEDEDTAEPEVKTNGEGYVVRRKKGETRADA